VGGRARQQLGGISVSTEVPGVHVKRAENPLPQKTRLSQVLSLVSELEKTF